MSRLGIDPIKTLAQLGTGDVACGPCKGSGRLAYQTKRGPVFFVVERRCHCCNGSGKERISPDLRRKSLNDVARHLPPGAMRESAIVALGALLNSENERVRLEAASVILERSQNEQKIVGTNLSS